MQFFIRDDSKRDLQLLVLSQFILKESLIQIIPFRVVVVVDGVLNKGGGHCVKLSTMLFVANNDVRLYHFTSRFSQLTISDDDKQKTIGEQYFFTSPSLARSLFVIENTLQRNNVTEALFNMNFFTLDICSVMIRTIFYNIRPSFLGISLITKKKNT